MPQRFLLQKPRAGGKGHSHQEEVLSRYVEAEHSTAQPLALPCSPASCALHRQGLRLPCLCFLALHLLHRCGR